MRKVKLNCNIGCNSKAAYYTELEKIRRIKECGCIPDMMMDLSLYRAEKPLYKQIQEMINIPVGTVFAYIPFSKGNGLDWKECQDYLIKLGKDKVNFVTISPQIHIFWKLPSETGIYLSLVEVVQCVYTT